MKAHNSNKNTGGDTGIFNFFLYGAVVGVFFFSARSNLRRLRKIFASERYLGLDLTFGVRVATLLLSLLLQLRHYEFFGAKNAICSGLHRTLHYLLVFENAP